MQSTGQQSGEVEEALRDLTRVRGEARLKAHLLSMDTRRRLSDLESEIESFERRLATRGDWVAEHVMTTARGLTHALAALASKSEPEPARVRDLMSRDPITCRPAESLREAAHRMREGDFGVLPVVDEHGKPIGMLTDRDICMFASSSGSSLAELSVGDAMSRGARTCKASHTLRAAMDLMVTHQVRRLPVVGDDGAVVGIVSLADVALLTQAPANHSQEARVWMPSVLAGICESITAAQTRTSRVS
jgi:CBS domain-containing protein